MERARAVVAAEQVARLAALTAEAEVAVLRYRRGQLHRCGRGAFREHSGCRGIGGVGDFVGVGGVANVAGIGCVGLCPDEGASSRRRLRLAPMLCLH